MRQKDFNWLIGYSSVAHMGFVFLGIATLNLVGVTGAVLVMIAHGFLAALTFGLSGYLYQQTGTLEMDQLGGLLRRLPFIGAALMMAAFAGCGLPGFANFAGEITVFFGAWTELPARDGSGLLGRADHRRGLHAARGARHAARARCRTNGPACRTPRISGASCRSCCCSPALLVFGCFPRLLTDKIKSSVAERSLRRLNPPAQVGRARRPRLAPAKRGRA